MSIPQTEFDLKRYDLTSANVYPYFPQPYFNGKEYCIYEGATGNNRFQYFKVSQESNAGQLCKEFIEKYYEKCEKRYEYYEDAVKLIESCKTDAIDKIIGLDAYLKYWNDCLNENDKLKNNIYSIQHFEALKEWFILKKEKHIQNNESDYLNDDVRNADIEQLKEDIANRVFNFLKQSERSGERKYSAISKVQANELIKFYNWLSDKTPQQTETKTEQETPKKFTVKEYALTYIFDLYANGRQIPTNKTEGGYNKKVLIQTGIQLYQFDKKKDTFYRAVKNVAEKFDLNKKQDLINISQSWIEAVMTLSKDWNKTKKYLKEKELIGE